MYEIALWASLRIYAVLRTALPFYMYLYPECLRSNTRWFEMHILIQACSSWLEFPAAPTDIGKSILLPLFLGRPQCYKASWNGLRQIITWPSAHQRVFMCSSELLWGRMGYKWNVGSFVEEQSSLLGYTCQLRGKSGRLSPWRIKLLMIISKPSQDLQSLGCISK